MDSKEAAPQLTSEPAVIIENGVKVPVSEDDDYVSGNEEFEMASDKPVSILNDDGVVGKGDKGIGEVVEIGGEAVDGNEGDKFVVESQKEESAKEVRDELGEPQEGVVYVNSEESGLSEAGDVNGMPKEDSVVDAIDVNIDVVHPGIAVVGESKETVVVADRQEAKEVSEVNVASKEIEPESVEKDDKLDASEVDVASKEIEPESVEKDDKLDASELDSEVDKPVTSDDSIVKDANAVMEKDSIVDAIDVKVDVVEPGVVVVGENKEAVLATDGQDAKEVSEVDVASKEIQPGSVGKDEKLDGEVDKPITSDDSIVRDVNAVIEEDSVVDAIDVNVDVVMPGVVVVGESKEAGNEANVEEVKEVSEVEVESKEIQPKLIEKDENLNAEGSVDVHSEVQKSITSSNDLENAKTPDVVHEPTVVSESIENDLAGNSHIDRDVVMETNDDDTSRVESDNGLVGGASEESNATAKEIREVDEDMDDEVNPDDSLSDKDMDQIFGNSGAADKFIEELERESHTGADSSYEQSQIVDGQIVTDSEEEDDTGDAGDGEELFDSAALAALLKAATGADSDGGGSITISSQDGSRLFSVERPAGLGSSIRALRPAPRPNLPNIFSPPASTGGGESEDNLSEEEKKKLEKLQAIRVKFLRLVHRLGCSPEESVAAQVLYRLALLGGRQGSQIFNLDAAKRLALQLEEENRNNLEFSINILVLGKSGVGKSATINSIFGEDKASISAFETGTASPTEICGLADGVKVRVIDTPGLKPSVVEQGFNRGLLSSVKKFTKKTPFDVVLYVDRLDAQSRDLNDLPLLKTVTSALGSSIWRNAVVTLTHAASAPPDGPTGTPLSYEVFVSQRSHVVQQSIGHAVGDLRMMSPSLMNPVSLVENHPSCRKNRDGQKILPNGQSWRGQLLLLCYSMKILSEAGSLAKPQDPFDHRKLFGFRARSPPLPYMLSSMLQSRPHPKLPSDQGGDNGDSDIDLDDLSDADEEEDEYDQLPPFKPLRKAQIARLNKEQRKAYFEEYDYRVKLLQKKQWKEELRRMREIKNKGNVPAADYGLPEDDADNGAAAPVSVPLPDMAIPPSFDSDYPAYRYRFLEPTSQFLARPVLDSHGWDHDCGYDGVNLEHSLAIASRFPAAYTVQITKDKKDFSISVDSSIAAKMGEHLSSMAGFDVQTMGKQLAYVVRAETKTKSLKKNKAAAGISLTFLGENVVPGLKVEDQITLGKQYVLVGSAGTVRSQHDTAYGANFELQRRELDYPIGQVQSTLSMSIIKWRGDLALGFNSLAQFSIGRNSKVAVRAGINNKLSGQVTVRTSSSEHLSLALTAIIPTALSIYRKLYPGAADKYSIY